MRVLNRGGRGVFGVRGEGKTSSSTIHSRLVDREELRVYRHPEDTYTCVEFTKKMTIRQKTVKYRVSWIFSFSVKKEEM